MWTAVISQRCPTLGSQELICSHTVCVLWLLSFLWSHCWINDQTLPDCAAFHRTEFVLDYFSGPQLGECVLDDSEVSLLPIYHQAFHILFFRGSQLGSDDSTIILLPTSPPLIRCSVLTSLLFVFSGPQLSERVLWRLGGQWWRTRLEQLHLPALLYQQWVGTPLYSQHTSLLSAHLFTLSTPLYSQHTSLLSAHLFTLSTPLYSQLTRRHCHLLVYCRKTPKFTECCVRK